MPVILRTDENPAGTFLLSPRLRTVLMLIVIAARALKNNVWMDGWMSHFNSVGNSAHEVYVLRAGGK